MPPPGPATPEFLPARWAAPASHPGWPEDLAACAACAAPRPPETLPRCGSASGTSPRASCRPAAGCRWPTETTRAATAPPPRWHGRGPLGSALPARSATAAPGRRSKAGWPCGACPTGRSRRTRPPAPPCCHPRQRTGWQSRARPPARSPGRRWWPTLRCTRCWLRPCRSRHASGGSGRPSRHPGRR